MRSIDVDQLNDKSAVDAIPVKWMEDQIRRYADIPRCKEAFETVLAIWQHCEDLKNIGCTSVVHCKDCNEWRQDDNQIYRNGHEGTCAVHNIVTGDEYYCGDGEHR